ncbi:hypothetical protein DC20_06510 [Rufibacter tibetensis]|uniref:Mechanosensitive ion channel MscS domain-containing protein n=1 Tax=Rufibacter tibetensis TaxID=512763 RepID=A0A0P0C842_9BACT|nr:hypothetical protein DC20_06510 [Rufibacter tibetensis]
MGNLSSGLLRVAEEYWERFLFLLPNIILAILILFVALWLAARIRLLLESRLDKKSHNQITTRYIAMIAKWAITLLGLMLVLHTLGLSGVAGGIFAGAGVSALVVGFAFKDIAENFLAGLILAFNRPFEVNDSISVNDLTGKVLDLSLRTTHIRTFDSKDIFIPNGTILNSSVTNLTYNGLIRMDFVVGIDYNDNIQDAIDLIEKTTLGIDGVYREDPPYALVEELATNTVNIKVFFWVETDDYKKGALLLRGRMMQETAKALLGNGFGLPANIQELKLYDYQKSIPVQMMQPAEEQ